MQVVLADGTKLECADDPFAEGGEGWLFWDKAGTHVVKIYKHDLPDREQTLQKVLGPEYSVVLGEPYWDSLFAWPKAIIRQPALGITMLRAPKGCADMKWFLQPKAAAQYAKKHGAATLGTWANRLSVAIKMARVVRRMHYRGLCHSDLSFNNFMIDLKASNIVLLDCDGLVVPGFLPPKVLGTPMCMAPELMAHFVSSSATAEPCAATDLHALSTLIYWLLLYRHPLCGPKEYDPDPAVSDALKLGPRALFIEHPTDASNRPAPLPIPYPSMFTSTVRELVEKAFVHGLHDPTKRPHAAEWERFLSRMEDSVVPCENTRCPLGYFVLDPQRGGRCPGCGTPLRRPATLPILNLYIPQKGRQGQFKSDHGYTVVGWPGRTLHLWHADPAKGPGPGADLGAKAVLEHDARQGKWYLSNLDLHGVRLLQSPSGHVDLPPGQKAELVDGGRILLGPPEQCRLVFVQMLRLV